MTWELFSPAVFFRGSQYLKSVNMLIKTYSDRSRNSEWENDCCDDESLDIHLEVLG